MRSYINKISLMNPNLGQHIRNARQAVGVTQCELADGVSKNQSTISKIENGSVQLTTELARRIKTFLSGRM